MGKTESAGTGKERGGRDRRRALRRSIPYVRSAVLEVDRDSHIVTVADLGPEGAFLATRLPVAPQQTLRLRMILPRDGHQVVIPCQLVWRSERFDPAAGRPAGLAVRFQGLDAGAVRRVEEFAAEGFLPSPKPAPREHFEYRVVERHDLDAAELNALGIDGWAVTAVVPSPSGVRIVLMRRL